MTNTATITLELMPINNDRLMILCGEHRKNLKLIEDQLQVVIKNVETGLTVHGDKAGAERARQVLENLYAMTKKQKHLTLEEIHLALHAANHFSADESATTQVRKITTPKGDVKAYSKNQQLYLNYILSHDINFGIGPAGTGKTYLAVACAVEALTKDQVRRILLVRPAVEAGERLGFLPGDLAQKVDPYLRPLYDALYEMLGFEQVNKLLEKNVLEIAPLAYMRGRTLNHAFIILDESQNTTAEQMKMFLTRIGFGSKAVITGDVTQIDLMQGRKSGLLQVMDVLENIDGISFTFFDAKDVVRHRLVQSIVEAYEQYEQRKK